MKLNTKLIAAVASSLAMTVLGSASFALDGAGAAAMLKENKCTKCHAFKAFGVAKSEEESKAPDLSKLSAEIMGQADPADYCAKWINKEVERKGKKHRMKFKGSAGDLKALSAFLVSNSKK